MFSLLACTKNLTPKVKADSNWTLAEWPGKEIPANASATLRIQDQKISGKSFCNQYFGSGVFNGNALTFGSLGGTKMFCNDLDKAERDFLADLAAVNSGSLKGNKLILRKNEQVLLVFQKSQDVGL